MQGGEGGSKDWSKSIKGGGGPPWRDPPLGQFWSIPNWQATEITQNEPPPVNWNIDKWELQLRSNDLAFVIRHYLESTISCIYLSQITQWNWCTPQSQHGLACLSHSSPTLPNWSSTKPATVLCGIGDPTVRSFTNLSRTKGSGETLMTSIWDFIPQWPGSQHSIFVFTKKMFKHVQKMMHSTIILTIKKQVPRYQPKRDIWDPQQVLFTKMLRKTSMGSSRWIGKLSCPWEKLFPNTIGLKMSSAEFYGEESADNRRSGNAKTHSIPGFIYHLPVSHSFSIGMSCWESGGWIYRWHTAWIGHDRKRGSSLHQGWHDSMFSDYIRKIISACL